MMPIHGAFAEAMAEAWQQARGLVDDRVGMAQQHGSPRPDVIDVPIAVLVLHVRTVRSTNEDRRAPHAPESSNWRIDPARNHAAGALIKTIALVTHHPKGTSTPFSETGTPFEGHPTGALPQ